MAMANSYRAGAWTTLHRLVGWTFLPTSLLAVALRHGPALIPLLALGLAISLLARIPSRIDVGPDGVLLRWLGLRRFVSFRSVRGLSYRLVRPRSVGDGGLVSSRELSGGGIILGVA